MWSIQAVFIQRLIRVLPIVKKFHGPLWIRLSRFRLNCFFLWIQENILREEMLSLLHECGPMPLTEVIVVLQIFCATALLHICVFFGWWRPAGQDWVYCWSIKNDKLLAYVKQIGVWQTLLLTVWPAVVQCLVFHFWMSSLWRLSWGNSEYLAASDHFDLCQPAHRPGERRTKATLVTLVSFRQQMKVRCPFFNLLPSIPLTIRFG